MTTATEAGELVLALLQKNPQLEYRPRELPELIGVDVELPALEEALAPLLEAGSIVCRRAGRGVFYSAPDAPAETNEPVPFNAAHWADGDVDLYGLIPLEDGGHRMTAEMVGKLKRLITWTPAV